MHAMKIFCTIALLSLAAHLYAQEGEKDRHVVSGGLIDEQGVNIPYASISAHRQSDSSMVAGVTSDENGLFSIPLSSGNYYLKISFLSYKEKLISPVNITDSDVEVGTVVLLTASKLLEEVVIEGERSQMELQLDKRIFNVGQDLSNSAGTALDVLNNVPSVNVDTDGSVSLRGSENVRVLINGKPSGLTSRDPAALRMLQGNMIERIEVITNPSARYDAEGEVGIINIILKKNSAAGFNGTLSANGGYPDNYGGAFTFNYKKNKINFFTSYGVSYRSSPGYSVSNQRISGDTSFAYTQNSDRVSNDLSHNLSGGLDYFIDDFNTITGSIQYNTGSELNRSTLLYTDFTNDQVVGTTVRTDRELEDEENMEGNINYRREFGNEDNVLTVDFKYIMGLDGETSDLTQSPSGGETIMQRSDNTAREKNWLIQSDYIKTWSNDFKLEAGLKSATRQIDNEYGLEQLDDSGEWYLYPAFNNNLKYLERIHAAYIMGGKKFKRLSTQTGLRGEYSDITTELTETNDINHRQYFNLFPSVNIGYELKKDHTLQFSYSYRISRPGFRDLLPFSNFTDSRVFFVGNPNLNPEYTHSLEAGYLLNSERGSLLTSVYYRKRNNVIQRITKIDTAGIVRTMPVNLAIQNSYGLEFNLSLSASEWWQINSSANFFRAITEGEFEEELFYGDTYSFNSRTTSKMTFFKKLAFQASLNYRGPRVTTQGKDLSSYSIDLGLSKDILKGRGTITANVRDLFNTRLRRTIIDTDDYYSESESQGRRRQFSINFTYRINRTKEREKRERDDGDDDDSVD